jgi:hypothetical protein
MCEDLVSPLIWPEIMTLIENAPEVIEQDDEEMCDILDVLEELRELSDLCKKNSDDSLTETATTLPETLYSPDTST